MFYAKAKVSFPKMPPGSKRQALIERDYSLEPKNCSRVSAKAGRTRATGGRGFTRFERREEATPKAQTLSLGS
jgi:hypothetical protein